MWNKAFWLTTTIHVTSFNQAEWIISSKFVYDIGSGVVFSIYRSLTTIRGLK